MSKKLIEQLNRTVARDFLKLYGILAPNIQSLATDQTPLEQRILEFSLKHNDYNLGLGLPFIKNTMSQKFKGK